MLHEPVVKPLIPVRVALVLLQIVNPVGEFHQRSCRRRIVQVDGFLRFALDASNHRGRRCAFDEACFLLGKPLGNPNEYLLVVELTEQLP